MVEGEEDAGEFAFLGGYVYGAELVVQFVLGHLGAERV